MFLYSLPIYKVSIDVYQYYYDLQMCFTNDGICNLSLYKMMLFTLKIALCLREIALFYTNSNYKFSHFWSTFEGHKSYAYMFLALSVVTKLL